ncbi:glycerophosphodiester phosphodiesterase [Alteraurantiacibacter aquimixticola]|nr:glycerophosphodiester phosphodiesterase family protein [Alteraurantiacibacter aquimixticola]
MKLGQISRRGCMMAMGGMAAPALLNPSAALAAAPAANVTRPRKPYLIAHRGGVVDRTRTENSLPALREAMRRSYTHVEVDVRCTRDGQAVCLHDGNLARTTGVDVNINEVTLDQLHERVSPEVVPSFDTFARECAAGQMHLMVDVKETPDLLLPAFAESVNASLHRHGLAEGALLIGSGPVIERIGSPAKVKWRKSFAEFEREVIGEGGDPARYFAFDHPLDFRAVDIAGFRRVGVDVIVTVNLLHYLEEDPIAQGQADLAYARGLGVDGYQIDMDYEYFTRNIISL